MARAGWRGGGFALAATVLLAGTTARGQELETTRLDSPELGQGQAQVGVDPALVIGAPDGPPLEDEALDRETLAVAGKLRCPICQGLSVADSPSASALAMLSQVRDLLAQGYGREQVYAYFESTYGEFVRLQPKADGFNLLVWIGPVVALLAGIALLVMRQRRGTSSTGSALDEELDPYLEQVRADLQATTGE